MKLLYSNNTNKNSSIDFIDFIKSTNLAKELRYPLKKQYEWLKEFGAKDHEEFYLKITEQLRTDNFISIIRHKVKFINSHGEECLLEVYQHKPSEKLHNYVESNITKQHILYVPGRGNTCQRFTEESIPLAVEGYNVWTFNYPGIMGSTGDFYSNDDLINSVRSVVNYLLEEVAIERRQLICLGNSMGALIMVGAMQGNFARGIRLIYSNGPQSISGFATDYIKSAQLGFLRPIVMVLPIPIIIKGVTRLFQIEFNAAEIYGAPSLLRQTWSRKNDGLITKDFMLSDGEQKLLSKDYTDDCPDDFKEARDHYMRLSWLQSKKDCEFPDEEVPRFIQSLIPRPQKRSKRSEHFMKLMDLQPSSLYDGCLVQDLLNPYAIESYNFLTKNPQYSEMEPVPETQVKNDIFNFKNALIIAVPLLFYAVNRASVWLSEDSSDYECATRIYNSFTNVF